MAEVKYSAPTKPKTHTHQYVCQPLPPEAGISRKEVQMFSSLRTLALALSVTIIALAFVFSASSFQHPASAQSSLRSGWISTNDPPFNLGRLTRLLDGRVISVGIAMPLPDEQQQRRVAIYDPLTDTWRETTPMIYPRSGSTSILLFDGRLLVVGGVWFVGSATVAAGNPEIFDPSTEKWTEVQQRSENINIWTRSNIRYLPNGKVLTISQIYNNAYLFDPMTGEVKLSSPPQSVNGGNFPSSTILGDGKGLFLSAPFRESSPSAEIFDPETETWSPVNLPTVGNTTVEGTLAATLSNGKALGVFRGVSITFDPMTKSWGDVANCYLCTSNIITLSNGELLAYGYNAAEIYNPTSKFWRTVNAPTKYGFGSVLLASGQVYTGNEIYTVDFGSNLSPTVTATSSASFRIDSLARGSLATAFGTNLSNSTDSNSVSIRIKGSDGLSNKVDRVFAVTPNQINFLVPDIVPEGQAELTITNSNGQTQRSLISVVGVSPGLFTANAGGVGAPAAVVLRIKSDGSRSYEPVAVFDSATGKFVPVSINLGVDGESVFLVFFGTGIQRRTSLDNSLVYIGGVKTPALYVGKQGVFDGLDQINVQIPRILAGRDDVDVLVTIDGKMANPVSLKIK